MYNDQMEPLISVIIPTNNEAERIALALDSMIQQTYKNLEILVIDDHSTDNTKEIVEEMIKKDPRIRYHPLPYEDKKRKNWRGFDINGGYLARNYGFSLAQGEYIVLQDADDSSFINRIEVQYKLLKKYNATMVGIHWMQLKDEFLDKKLDVDRIFQEKGEEAIVIRPEIATATAREIKEC
jgi:glycosyltransferase involved in cell wall biosynthesis